MSDNNIDVSVPYQEQNLSFIVPKEYTDRDVLLKIHNKKEVEPKTQKFRSFCITCLGNNIPISGKMVDISHLFTILKAHGLSKTLPMNIGLGPLKFINFDWAPHSYGGPTVWYFKWKGVECSITSNREYIFYIRIHDLTEGVGEMIINEITDELLKYWVDTKPVRSLIIYTTQQTLQGHRWVQHCSRLHRDIGTIYINKETKDKLINQLTKFYNSSDLYDRYGVTWKRSHLFHGPPGTGKTSTVLALASIFNKNISKLTLTPHLNSQDIELLFSTVQDNSFLLLEDVDALFTERKSNTSIDFSTLLNCLDGITTKRGLVVFMTTNHVTKLDEAFIRPGRVDLSLEFKLAGRQELHDALKVLASDYEHEHDEFLSKNTNMSIACLQKHLFECIMEEKKSILY